MIEKAASRCDFWFEILILRFFQIGRTERIDDNLNPKFQKQITIDYHFEEVQRLAFYLFDIDDKDNDVSKADFLGKCECTLGQVGFGNSKKSFSRCQVNLKVNFTFYYVSSVMLL